MILGRVIGEVWATKKHRLLSSSKLLIVRPHFWYEPSHRVGHLVAVDPHEDAGIGDDVIVCMGEPPRSQTGDSWAMPVDAAIMAVVDGCEIDESAFSGKRPLAMAGGGPRNLTVGKIRTEGNAP